MISIDAADTFFAECVRRSLANEPWPQWPEEWQGQDIERIVGTRSEFHGIAVLLTQSRFAFEGWPSALADRIREEARLASVWESTHKMALTALLRELAKANILPIIMKGTALAYSYYDNPAMRRRGDTDLLVQPADLGATRRILVRNGYARRNDPHGLYFQETWILSLSADLEHPIDLHWEPADRPLLQRILNGEEYVKNAVPLPRLAPNAAAPAAIPMLVHGAINQAWHVARGFYVEDVKVIGGRRLIWSVDYANIISGFSDEDWANLVQFCTERDARSITYSAIAGAQKDLHLSIPADVMQQLRQDPSQSRTHSYISAPDTLDDMRTDLLAAGNLSKRVKILSQALFSSRDHLVGKYPHLDHWPTFALQLRRYAEILNRKGTKAKPS